MNAKDLCKQKGHDLIVISSRGNEMEERVVRWCQYCGAIVIDLDSDGRVYPGRIMPMRFPAILNDQ